MRIEKALLTLGVLQLLFSVSLAISIVIWYVKYGDALGQITDSVAGSISSVAKVMTLSASTVIERQALIVNARQTLGGVHDLITAIKAAAINQRTIASQYAEAQTVNRFGDVVDSAGDGFMLSVLTRIDWEGGRPVIVMTHPFANVGQASKAQAGELRP